MDSGSIIEGYDGSAGELVPRFEAISSAEVYAPVAHLLPTVSCRMIDVGAGTGRDAAWFAGRGHDVLAVEPVVKFREAGMALHPSPHLEWLDDSLPELSRTMKRRERFEFVLLSAVWQHLDPDQRRLAMPKLRGLTAGHGLLIMSVRKGPGTPKRPVFPARVMETIELAGVTGLRLVFRQNTESVQACNRQAGVTWTWLVFAPG